MGPEMTVAFVPIEAPRFTRVNSTLQSASDCRLPSELVARGKRSLVNMTPWPMNTSSSISTPSHINVWEEILQRVNLMGRALGRYSSRPDLDWRFGVLESKSINAFSAPDGYVFITRGLYDMAESDDALAAILGHEISHITKRHALTIIERTESVAAFTSLAAEHSRNVQQAEAQLRQFDLGLEKIINTLFEKGFDPQTEYEADKEGRLLAVTSGYASGGLRAVLTDIEQHSSGNPDVFSTHPPFKERIKRLPE